MLFLANLAGINIFLKRSKYLSLQNIMRIWIYIHSSFRQQYQYFCFKLLFFCFKFMLLASLLIYILLQLILFTLLRKCLEFMQLLVYQSVLFYMFLNINKQKESLEIFLFILKTKILLKYLMIIIKKIFINGYHFQHFFLQLKSVFLYGLCLKLGIFQKKMEVLLNKSESK